MSTSNELNNHKLPSQTHTPTGMGIVINAAKSTGQNVSIPEYTTLNELYDVLAAESVGIKDGDRFYLRYYGIGIRGSRCIGEGGDGIERRRAYEHQPTDQNAFKPIPFVCREITNDLSTEERDKYRLRVVRKIGDKTYVFYYLKKIDFSIFSPSVKLGTKNPVNGNESQIPYVYKEGDLNPEPYELISTGSVLISNQYINGTGTMDLSLSSSDLDEIKNVCRIMFNDASVAATSELYLAYGIETTHTGPIGLGGTISYKELLSATVSYLITESYARDTNTNNKMPIRFEYGNSVPCLVQGVQTGSIPNDSISNIL